MGREKGTIMSKAPEKVMGGPMRQLARRLRCAITGHKTYYYKATGEFAITRDEDDMATAQCVVCGKTLYAPCGLMLPGFKLGTAPISRRNHE